MALLCDEEIFVASNFGHDAWAAFFEERVLVNIFIQVLPWLYLCYLTCSSEKTYFENVLYTQDLPPSAVCNGFSQKWWLFSLPVAAQFLFCLAWACIFIDAGFGTLFFFVRWFHLIPAVVSIKTMLAYVLDFEMHLPTIQSIDDIKRSIKTFEKETQEKIRLMNRLVIPNVLLWMFITLDYFWLMTKFVALGYHRGGAFAGFVSIFAFCFVLCYLLPAVYFTSVVNGFVARLDEQYCEDTNNVLGWLRNKKLGWKVFGIEMAPDTMKLNLYVLLVAIIAYATFKLVQHI